MIAKAKAQTIESEPEPNLSVRSAPSPLHDDDHNTQHHRHPER